MFLISAVCLLFIYESSSILWCLLISQYCSMFLSRFFIHNLWCLWNFFQLFVYYFVYIFFWSITYTKRELGWKAYSHYFYHFSSYVDARLFVDHDQASRLYSVANEEERPCGRTCPCLPLQDRARSDPYVFSLATNPFYLWLICTIFTEAGEEFVPKTLTQLYTWVMLVFAHRWVQCQTSFRRAPIIYSTRTSFKADLFSRDSWRFFFHFLHGNVP